uniref:Uncharacterized protein n=1 Tax=Ixodes scapularis TaxID=6945 RepID=A0A4D5RZ47_IXOSC
MVTGVLVPFLFFFVFLQSFCFFILKKSTVILCPGQKKKCIACNHPRFVKIFVVFRLVQGVRLHFFFFTFCVNFFGGI